MSAAFPIFHTPPDSTAISDFTPARHLFFILSMPWKNAFRKFYLVSFTSDFGNYKALPFLTNITQWKFLI